MKTNVIREWTGSFKESVITTDNVRELTYLKMGVDLLKEQHIESLDFYKKMLSEDESDKSKNEYRKSIRDYEENIKIIDGILESFDLKNEIPIEKYTIKKEKVSYEFNYDIRTLSDEEILKRLNNVFGDKELYMVPDFRRSTIKRLTILGHNGNIVVTFK